MTDREKEEVQELKKIIAIAQSDIERIYSCLAMLIPLQIVFAIGIVFLLYNYY
jgi:hypothetical protein